MVHINVAASAAAATASSSAVLSRPRRLPSSGSFHAGEPFPILGSPYDGSSEPGTSAAAPNRRRRRSTNPTPGPAAQGHSPGPIRRLSTHNRYHTFPTQPPKTPSEQPTVEPIYSPFGPGSARDQALGRDARDGHSQADGQDNSTGGSHSPISTDSSQEFFTHQEATPLPWKQLSLLALLSLAEQTALNSIGPYLPTMVASFPSIPPGSEGVYVGLLASAFALAQLATNLFWGYLSDRIGRKPVMLLGTSLLGGCFVFFGFCKDYKQLLAVHVAMGLLNGNAAVVPTCLGEVTDKTNQSRAFTWLPVMYSLGSITGPALGGLLVGRSVGNSRSGDEERYPFLAPNLTAAVLLVFSVVVLGIWFEETLERDGYEEVGAVEGARKVGNWVSGLRSRLFGGERQKGVSGWSSRWPTAHEPSRHHDVGEDENASDDNEEAPDERQTLLASNCDPPATDDNKNHGSLGLANSNNATVRQLANRTTLAVLISYLVFQLTNISFNSLYPIFASAPPPTGRDLGPSTIGLSLSLAGLATILFQGFLFQPLKARIGNLGTYRYSLLGMAISMALMPWIGYLDEDKPWLGLGTGEAWLYSELGVILVLKNICAVGGLSSVMLLVSQPFVSYICLSICDLFDYLARRFLLHCSGREFQCLPNMGLFS